MASKFEPVRASQSYQRFAWVTLALAALVALFASDRSDPAEAGAAVPMQASRLAVAPVRKSPAALNTLPPAAPADVDSEDGGDNTVSDQDDGENAAAPSPNDEPAVGDASTKPPVAGASSAAEAGQLLASSRNRSGGVDQGDEPIRAPAV